MNKIYRCIYNETLGTWVAVSELSRARGKRSSGGLCRTVLAATLALGGGVIGSSAYALDLTDASYSQIIVDGANSVTTTTSPVTVDPLLSPANPYISTGSTIPSSDSTVVVANGAQLYTSPNISASNNYTTTAFDLMSPADQLAYLQKNALDIIKTTKGQHGELEAPPVPVGVIQVIGNGTVGVAGTTVASPGNTVIDLAAGSNLTATGTAHGIYAANQTGNVTVNIAGNITTAPAVKTNYLVTVIDPTTNLPVTVSVPVVTAGGGNGVYVDTLTPLGGTAPDGSTIPNRNILITQNATSVITAGGAGIKAVADGTSNVTVTQEKGATINAGDGGIAAEGEAGIVTVNADGIINSGGNGIHAHAGGAATINVVVGKDAIITAGEGGIHAQSSQGSVNVDMNGTLNAAGTGIHAHSGTGDVTVNTTGTITAADGDGVHAHSSAGVITVNTGGDITATGFGIHAHSNVTGQDNIDSNGIVNVTTNNNITSGDTGIYARSGADVNINMTGNIKAGTYPVDPITGAVTYDLTTDPASLILPVGNGITARSSQSNVNVIANGNIDAKVDGIVASGAESVSVQMNGNITAGSKVFDSTGYLGGWDAKNNEYVSYTAGTGISAHSTQGAFNVVANGNITTVLDGIAASGQTGGSITTSGNITSELGNGINTSSSSGDVTLNNTANITVSGTGLAVDPVTGAISQTPTFAILGGKANEQVIQNSGTITGNVSLGSGSDSFTASGGAIIGGIAMGSSTGGNTIPETDTLTLQGSTNVSQLTYLDGNDAATTSSTDINTLNLGVNLTGSTYDYTLGTTPGNVALNNWSYINVLNGTTLKLGGNLDVPYSHLYAPDTYSLTIHRGGTLALATGITSATVNGDVDNHGTIDLHSGDANPVNTLAITGNYTAGSSLIVDTNLATGQSDTLTIGGTAGGVTTVTALNGLGDVTAADNKVSPTIVTVTDPNSTGTFVGSAPTLNAGEGQLILTSAAGAPQTYAWTLNALGTNTPIYKAEVAGYTQMPYANLLLGYETLGTLHERIGEQQTWAWDNCGSCQEKNNDQVWVRVRGNHTELTGENRFNFDADQFVAQAGYDFNVSYNPENGSRRHTGVTAAYGKSSLDFYDQYRAVNGLISSDKYMGKGTTEAGTLGLYSTYYTKNGSYLDLNSQVSYLENKYKPRDGNDVTQNGWGAALSAEVGRPYQLGNSHWLIEPQAQLAYQFLSLDSINDKYSHIKQDNQHGLRGRIGARLAYNAPSANYQTKTFYLTANILNDFVKPSDVTVGREVLHEDYTRTWGELGLGLQLPLAKSTYAFADARYQKGFGGEDRDGYSGTIGFKYLW